MVISRWLDYNQLVLVHDDHIIITTGLLTTLSLACQVQLAMDDVVTGWRMVRTD